MSRLGACMATFGLMLAAPHGVLGIEGVGLKESERVLVQEYWRDDSPQYVLANLRPTPIDLSIHAWRRGQVGDASPARSILMPLR